MSDSITLTFDQVAKSFPRVETNTVTAALSDINLELHSGEFVSIVGPSGCGKSTLLRLVAGLIVPTLGTISINDKAIEGPSKEVGMVFQTPTLFPWLTVEDNIKFSLKIQGQAKAKQHEVDAMLDLIHLTDFRNDYPAQLSGGMAQRVAVARSLIDKPGILLLDEPLGALDAFTRMKMQDEILQIWQQTQNLSMMVTHDVDEAVYMSTRILVMEAAPGRIKADRPIELSYPRVRTSREFTELRREILQLLDF